MVDAKPSPHTPESVLMLAGPELGRAVYRTANALLASSSDAEEVTLDVLVSLRKKLAELDPDELEVWLQGLPAWLNRAAVGKAKGRAKKHKHHSSRLEELAAMAEQMGEGALASAQLVREVLAYLPRRHRFVFVLEYGLGHTVADIAELAHLEPATVERTRAAVEHKLREYAKRHPLPAAMIQGMAPGVENNPLRHYMEVYGQADEVTDARIRRRLDTWLRDDPSQFELSGDHSFHDHTIHDHTSSANLSVDDLRAGAIESESQLELDPEPESTPELDAEPLRFQDRRIGGWLFGSVASIAVLALALAQVQLNARLEHVSDQLALVAGAQDRGDSIEGPVLLEPGEFVALTRDSRAEPARDATVELLRNDERGAEFRLTAGSIAFHVKPGEGVEWIVHDGRYDIQTTAARFRIVHTGSVPDVQVFEGKVRVVGGLLGADGLDVDAAQYSLATAMRGRGELPSGAPEDLAALATDEVYGRALALRGTDPEQAKTLLREIVDRGDDDWVSELAFEQLRTLVDPNERVELQVAYEQRFRDGQFAEAFAAIGCQAKDGDEDRDACWTEFALTYPNSLYGP